MTNDPSTPQGKNTLSEDEGFPEASSSAGAVSGAVANHSVPSASHVSVTVFAKGTAMTDQWGAGDRSKWSNHGLVVIGDREAMADANAGLDRIVEKVARALCEVDHELHPGNGRPIPWDDLIPWSRERKRAAARAAIAALQELNPPADVGGWQPISTAPRDGTAVLVARAGHEDVFSAYWQEDGGNGPGWADGCTDNYEDLRVYEGLTHWMPLPPPPPCGEGK